MAVIGLFVIVLVVALVALVVAGVLGRPADAGRDAAWLARTWVVPPDEVDVYSRYLARVRTHRRVGGLLGVLFAAVVGIVYAGTIGFGIVAPGPLGDVLFCGVAGVLVGAMSAEVYRLGLPRAATTASASLAPRPTLPGARQVLAARVVVTVAVGVGAALVITGHDVTTLLAAALGALLVGLCEATRAAVAHRRRAALSERALVVDGNLRAFAARTVAALELAAAVLAATWAASGAHAAGWLPGVLGMVVVLGGLVVAVVLLVKASPRPPRRHASSPALVAGTVPLA
ncbi:hypothetical protein Xcel_1093 [Xylanimonas cellulosilytica DSM 15894]|uniref:Uncharacterized protein n=1 Tax=Xylanimonas cellulosilytica (strain DSM 15894 / JCM 12276 / CECT 5975 / KCTC 9989 / LMG 20990 / NBRC 107835 / XIL07) TaxID=446471 RepID=D1BZH0_XYLCX|nr:hypothetical protein [Xylanimonas cellulosilytica]ACZ30124.1 hypothetical protein Xcel_1093 [Xylanimonas cellulosilytica DSM 15894]